MVAKENVSMLVRGASQLARREVCELGQVCSAPSASVSLMCLTHHAAVTLASFSSNAPTDFLLGSPPWSMRPPLPEAIYPSPDWAPLSRVTSLMNPSSILEGEALLSAFTSRPLLHPGFIFFHNDHNLQFGFLAVLQQRKNFGGI